MELCNRVDLLLRLNKLKKKQLLEATGISYNALFSTSRKKKNMPPEQVNLIANYLNISVDYLIRGDITEDDRRNYEKHMKIMEMEPSLYWGTQPCYLIRFWIDGQEGESREDTDSDEDRQRRREKTVKFARNFNYVPKGRQKAI